MARPLKRKKSDTKSMVLHAASKLFIERGYSETRIKDIASEANVSYNEVFRTLVDKETILCELVGLVLEFQFEVSKEVLKDVTDDKILFYAFETVHQLYIAESTEHIREMYLVSYSFLSSSKVIYKTITSKLMEVFKDRLPHLEEKDFYELEIASAGIMRGFISIQCDEQFTMVRKIKRFLETTFKLYDVEQSKIEEAINFVSQFNFDKYVNQVMSDLFNYLENRI